MNLIKIAFFKHSFPLGRNKLPNELNMKYRVLLGSLTAAQSNGETLDGLNEQGKFHDRQPERVLMKIKIFILYSNGIQAKQREVNILLTLSGARSSRLTASSGFVRGTRPRLSRAWAKCATARWLRLKTVSTATCSSFACP